MYIASASDVTYLVCNPTLTYGTVINDRVPTYITHNASLNLTSSCRHIDSVPTYVPMLIVAYPNNCATVSIY